MFDKKLFMLRNFCMKSRNVRRVINVVTFSAWSLLRWKKDTMYVCVCVYLLKQSHSLFARFFAWETLQLIDFFLYKFFFLRVFLHTHTHTRSLYVHMYDIHTYEFPCLLKTFYSSFASHLTFRVKFTRCSQIL